MKTKWHGWMIYDGGMILNWTGHYHKHTCIHDYVRDCGPKWSWEKLRKSGYRCVRVEITIVDK
jgi:hypothetical protein